MRRVFLIGLISMFFIDGFAQKNNDPVLLTIGGEDVLLSEFKAIYNKNNSDNAIDPKSLEEYLDLYINFKLKVREAEELGMDTASKFKKELAGYRNQLARPYLTDKEVTEELINEAYERMKTEVRASHILLSLAPNASPEDTLEVYNKILDLRKKAMGGTSFEQLAKENSNDPSASENGGDLGYFSALYMVYPFENQAYNTKKGEVSMPVRTRYGYHIIKVTDKRPSRGEITVAHIMVKLAEDASDEEAAKAETKINEIYQQAIANDNFEKLAMEFSDDKGSSKNGGKLAPFKSGKMILEFEDAAFALKKDGEISKPVRTKYGWHVIKRLGMNELKPLEDIRVDLKEKISRDTRSDKSKFSMLKKIKTNYGFKEKSESLTPFYSVVDSTYFKGKWEASKAKGLNDWMFKLDKNTYTQQDFAQHIVEKQAMSRPIEIKIIVDLLYEDFVQTACFNYEDSKLEEKHTEFKVLVDEYHDGILLFDLTDEKVWSKAVKDTIGLEKFFNANSSNYKWGERLDAIVYSCSSEEIAIKAKNLVAQRAQNTISPDSLKSILNKDSQLNISLKSSKFSKGDNKIIDELKWEKGITEIKKVDDRYVFVEVKSVLSPANKKLDEVRGLVTSDYQNYLEKEWIKELKAKYKVTVNKEVLKGIK